MPKRELTLRQRRFVEALPTAKNQRDAAIKAGYSPTKSATGSTAANKASQMMRNPYVLPAIQAMREATTSRKVMSVLKRKERLSRLAVPDPEHPDPVRAIDILNRMENLYIDRQQSENLVRVQIEIVTTPGKTVPTKPADR